MPGIRYSLIINGVPVVAAGTEIDLTTAEQLRMVLFKAAGADMRSRAGPPGGPAEGT